MLPELSLRRGGTVLDLDESNGITVTPGVQGFDTPPVVLSETAPADFDGSIVTNVRYQPREVFVPIGVTAEDSAQLRGMTRTLATLLNPQGGPVTLRVEHVDTNAQLLPAAAQEGRATEWEAATASAIVDEVTSPRRSGTHALRVQLNGVGSGSTILGARLPSAKRLTVEYGRTYDLSAWVRMASGTVPISMTVLWYASSGTLLSSRLVGNVTATSSAWFQTKGSVTPPLGASKMGIEFRDRAGAWATYYIDDISVTQVPVVREITGFASASLSDTLESGEGARWRRLGISLRCEDPLWSGPDTTTLGLTGSPFSVTNNGDAIAWPTWTFALASGYPLTITNTTAPGKPQLAISDALSAVTLDTDPRDLSCINKTSGAAAWQVIGASSRLFPFYPGDNVITGTNVGGLSTATATFRSRWLTAW